MVRSSDVSRVLEETLMLVQQRKEERFVPLKSKSILKKAEDEAGLSAAEINKFFSKVAEFYNTCHAYQQKWMLPLNEFSIFNWMLLVSVPQWNLVEQTVEFLHAKGQSINDSLLFDQFSCLKACIEAVLNQPVENSEDEESEGEAPPKDIVSHSDAANTLELALCYVEQHTVATPTDVMFMRRWHIIASSSRFSSLRQKKITDFTSSSNYHLKERKELLDEIKEVEQAFVAFIVCRQEAQIIGGKRRLIISYDMSSRPNLGPGTIGLLKGDNFPPLPWQLAVIQEAIHGRDGQVWAVILRTSH
ncbi:hypothetical protein C0J52_19922 [Blattella germanica]|nr:hypothetical protein C0J52_19922 [Blattella germanica]